MQEIKGNIWDYLPKGWVVITTNGFVKHNGQCVMGRGTALQAAIRFPSLPKMLGDRIKEGGNNVYMFTQYRIVSFPVKHHWVYKADLKLISKSCEQLRTKVGMMTPIPSVYLPRPGCGNGQLSWEDVKPIVKNILWPDWFNIVEIKP